MSIPPDLSIILPALRLNDDLIRCVHSIRAALNRKVLYEIIIITPDIHSFTDIRRIDNLQICGENILGIYQAMNSGIRKAKGRYLYFIGQDDILLPSAANAVLQGKANEAELILADVFWGKNRIFKNVMSTKRLAWTNWCHQGIFYNRLRFMREIGEYPVQFKAQADHYVNIIFSSAPLLRLTKYNGCIAWYSADGFSSRSPDLIFRRAFPALVRKHIGSFSAYLVIFRRVLLKIWRVCQWRLPAE